MLFHIIQPIIMVSTSVSNSKMSFTRIHTVGAKDGKTLDKDFWKKVKRGSRWKAYVVVVKVIDFDFVVYKMER